MRYLMLRSVSSMHVPNTNNRIHVKHMHVVDYVYVFLFPVWILTNYETQSVRPHMPTF